MQSFEDFATAKKFMTVKSPSLFLLKRFVGAFQYRAVKQTNATKHHLYWGKYYQQLQV
jgi:hypothetical protein